MALVFPSQLCQILSSPSSLFSYIIGLYVFPSYSHSQIHIKVTTVVAGQINISQQPDKFGLDESLDESQDIITIENLFECVFSGIN